MSHERFIESVHPDDMEYVDARWTVALKGEPHDIEHRIIVGGECRWVHEKSEITFDEHGRAIMEIGTV